MNILFYRYGSICEPDILEVFHKLQFQVFEDTLEITEKNLPVSKRLASLTAILETHPIDFVFSINFFPFLSTLCERLHMLYLCLSVDCPVLELFSDTLRNDCNRIFLFDYAQYERFLPQNPDCIFYLPLATNTNRWDQVLSEFSPTEDTAYRHEISFIGSLYHEKSPLSLLNSSPLSEYGEGYADGLIEAQLKIFGSNFLEDAVSDEFVQELKEQFPDFPQVPNPHSDTDRYVAAHYYLGMRAAETERIRTLNLLAKEFPVALYTRSDTSLLQGVECLGGVSTHTEMPVIFRTSKINLNITMRPIQTGLSLRIWDILGCGGFLLSNYQAEIPEYFTDGRELVCYESPADLMEKVRYYLAHEDIRREIARNGYEKVKQLHTWEHRIAAMLSMVFTDP